MTFKILCVDDDTNILQGYKRALRKDFDITTAEGGLEALSIIAKEGTFAVIVSDMRMPGMDGVQFLTKVKELSPFSVRMMLTGNADQQTAIDAVNEGNIFRFMNKPCSPEVLGKALVSGIEQHRLLTVEHELLEKTLNQSIQVLVDILAMVNPTAFSRSNRVKKIARELAELMNVTNPWEVEFAALLSQIGCVTVPEEILQKISKGEALTEKETALFHQHPQIGHDLIARIPRLETVAEIIANQSKRFHDEIVTLKPVSNSATLDAGARILKIAFDYDKLIVAGHLPLSAYHELLERVGWYDPSVLHALRDFVERIVEEFVTVEVLVTDLKPGMVLQQPLYSLRDALLLSAGQEITMTLILRLISFADTGFIGPLITVNVPVSVEDLQPVGN